MSEKMTHAEIEAEIDRLKSSYYVALARKERMLRYQRTRVMESLRREEKEGMELDKSGITMESLEEMARGLEDVI